MTWYRPDSSVIVDLTLSIKAGLEISTPTPGNTAPDVSFTVPVIALVCADTIAGKNASDTTAPTNRDANVRMIPPPKGFFVQKTRFELGIYGLRARVKHQNRELAIATMSYILCHLIREAIRDILLG